MNIFEEIERALTREFGLRLESVGRESLSSALASRISLLFPNADRRRLETEVSPGGGVYRREPPVVGESATDGTSFSGESNNKPLEVPSGLSLPEAYLHHFLSAAEERRALYESLSVTETWFFRDGEPFELFTHEVLDRYSRGISRPFRVLSAPCSSGEEPYSLAIALLDAGLGADFFTIDGIDLNRAALETARAGIYTNNSFRSRDLGFRKRYFMPRKTFWVLDPAIRRSVQFIEENILAPEFGSCHRPYHSIFCRNLMIYLSKAARTLLLENLDRLLVPGGLLFVGHAELSGCISDSFTPCGPGGAFALRKNTAAIPASHTREQTSIAISEEHTSKTRFVLEMFRGDIPSLAAPLKEFDKTGKTTTDKFSSGKAETKAEEKAATKVGEGVPANVNPRDSSSPGQNSAARDGKGDLITSLYTPEKHVPSHALSGNKTLKGAEPIKDRLVDAQNMADRGLLNEAAAICEEIHHLEGPCPDSYFLLGVVREAQGRSRDAEECFQRVLYLNPDHEDAIHHLALLREAAGDAKGAALLRNRARRKKLLSGGTE
ncbi:MAG: CheR family methyltransferase [Candidatus Ozemobacteraceae bacterium]